MSERKMLFKSNCGSFGAMKVRTVSKRKARMRASQNSSVSPSRDSVCDSCVGDVVLCCRFCGSRIQLCECPYPSWVYEDDE